MAELDFNDDVATEVAVDPDDAFVMGGPDGWHKVPPEVVAAYLEDELTFEAAGAAAAAQAAAVQRANHTGTQLASTVSDFAEAVDDRVAALLVAGTNVTLTYNDATGQLTIGATGGGGGGLTQEEAEDIVASMIQAGSHTNVTVNYTDNGASAGSLSFSVSAAAILAALLTVDGPASGLNADLLDGNEAAAFVLSGTEQPLDADLTAIAALTTTSFGRALLEVANAGALRTAAGLGTIATQSAAAVSITGGAVTGITDILVADGGTGASTASAARTNLGLVIGTDVQAFDSDLAAIAALTTTSFGRDLLVVADAAALRTAAGLGTLATLSTITSAEITDGTIVNGDINAAAAIALSKLATDPLARANHTGTQLAATISDFASAVGAIAQPLDSDLTAIAALTTTSYGRSVLETASASALRTLAGLVIGTNVQAHDADLVTIGGLAPTDNDFLQRKSSAWTNRTPAQVLADLAAVGTTFQPLDSDLTAVAGLSPTNDDIVQRKSGAWTNRTMAQLLADLAAVGTTFQPLDSDLTAIAALTTTSYGRAVLALANQAALMALLSAASETAQGIVELATTGEATTGTDTARAVTPAGVKAYVDASTLTAAQALALPITINAQTGTTYTPVAGDAGKLITLSNASPITLTVPPNSSVAYAVGTEIRLAQIGAGLVTVAEGSGVSVEVAPGDTPVFIGQNAQGVLTKIATDTWLLAGQLEPA